MLYDDYGQRLQLRQRLKSGANWFYSIAALSMITSLLTVSGAHWRFFLSLGITQFIDGFALGLSESVGTAGLVIGVVLNIFITAAFAIFGVFASKKHQWAFILGMVLFALDSLLLLLDLNVFGILFHGLAFFYIFRGFQAARELANLEREETMQPPPPPPQTAPASV